MGRKQCGKRRNYLLRAISPFPTVFSKDMQKPGLVGKGVFGSRFIINHRLLICVGNGGDAGYNCFPYSTISVHNLSSEPDIIEFYCMPN